MSRRRHLHWLVIEFLILTLWISIRSVAPAMSLTPWRVPLESGPGVIAVDHFGDTFDLTDGGCTQSNNYAHCGLREALEVANSAGGEWHILLAAGTYSLTRPMSSDLDANDGRDLKVKGNVTVEGKGPEHTVILARYDPGVRARVISFYPSATATLSGTTVSGGHAPDAANGNGNKDAAWPGGGILNQGVLTVTNCLVWNNRAGNGEVVDFSHPDGCAGGDGGGIYNSAEAGNPGRLVVLATQVISNRAGDGGRGQDMQGSPTTLGSGGPGGGGGGIANRDGVVLIQDSIILSNTAGAGGATGGRGGSNAAQGAVGGNGGGVYSAGPSELTVLQSVFRSNRAGRGGDTDLTVAGNAGDGGDGGGIYSESPLTIIACTLSGNYAGFGGNALYKGVGGHGSDGGGLEAYGDAEVRLESSTISGNHGGDGGLGAGGERSGSGGDAGGIDFEARMMTIENSTLSDNYTGRAGPDNTDDGDGGAINVQKGAICLINHSTFSGNSAGQGTGGAIFSQGTTVASNAIVARNSANGAGPDIMGDVVSGGYNLISDTVDATITGQTSLDLYNIDPMLGPLRDNGGPTFTQALSADSPAIDAALCLDLKDNPLSHDQRGMPRPQGQTCDIGAYEAP